MIKSVIDIDINSEKFVRFKTLYDAYQAQLEKMPHAWAQATKEQGKSASELEKMAAALLAQTHLAHESEDEDKKRLTRLTASERAWTSMAKSASSISKSVLDTSGSLLKWGSIIAGGLIGGSLFGLNHMARDVSNSRRSAMGLGMTPGERRAFDINFERLVDPNFLGDVAEMKMDPSKAGPLYTMGVGTSGSTADTAIALMNAMRARALSTPPELLGTLDASTGLNEGVDTWRRFHEMGNAEYQAQLAKYGRDKSTLGYGDDVALKWQNFTTQMERAGSTIFKVFVQGLAPLATPLTHLSDAFTKFLTTVLSGNGPLKQGIDNLSHWLETFSGEVGSNEFLESTRMFVSDVGWIAQALHKAAHPLDTSRGWTADKMAAFREWLQPTPAGVTSSIGAYDAYLARKDMQYGFPKGLIEKMKHVESGNSLYPAISKKGAIGTFQFMPETAKQYGFNPFDPVASANYGPKYLSDLRDKYNGDLAKALAAFNWGPGHLDDDIRAHPRDWGKYAPKETQDYVRKVGGLNIIVTNNTGGSAQVSVNSLAAGP